MWTKVWISGITLYIQGDKIIHENACRAGAASLAWREIADSYAVLIIIIHWRS